MLCREAFCSNSFFRNNKHKYNNYSCFLISYKTLQYCYFVLGYILQLFPVDSKLMEDMKNIHNKQAGNLIAMSPYVDIRLDNKNMKKPVIFSITNPGANRKRNDQAGMDTTQHALLTSQGYRSSDK